MARRYSTLLDAVRDVSARLAQLEHAAELIKTVLVVKEPGSVQAASAFDGLRKQIVAASGERRSHLAQVVTMSVAVSRATTVDDLRPQVREWLDQAGIAEVWAAPLDVPLHELFEDLSGAGLDHQQGLEVVEPAYLDRATGSLLRLGRARPAPASEPAAQQPADDLHGATS